MKTAFSLHKNKKKRLLSIKLCLNGDVQLQGLGRDVSSYWSRDRRTDTVNPRRVTVFYALIKGHKPLQQPPATESNLYVIRDVFSQSHVEYNQGLSRHGSMGEGIAASVRSHSALQVGPVSYRVHCLIPGRRQAHG